MNTFTKEDIRPLNLTTGNKQNVIKDRNFLVSRKNEWISVSCPACGAEDTTDFGIKDEIKYVVCNQCETVYTNPRPSQSLIHEFYVTSKSYAYWNDFIYPTTECIRREKIIRPRIQFLLHVLKKHKYLSNGVFIEVGAGFGSFCEELKSLKLFSRIIAIEPFPKYAESCRNKQLEVIQLPIEKINERGIADVIASFEVIEHLFNPVSFIENCYRLLKPNGLLYLSCPNIKGFDISILHLLSTTIGEGHYNYYHPKSISLLLERLGFEVIEIATPGNLDCGLVRNLVLDGTVDLKNQPFLQEVLINRWAELGQPFQTFLADNKLSSHMVILCRKIPPS